MTPTRWTRWFELNPDERRWIRVIIAIFLVGLVARIAYDYVHRHQSGLDTTGSTYTAPVAEARGH